MSVLLAIVICLMAMVLAIVTAGASLSLASMQGRWMRFSFSTLLVLLTATSVLTVALSGRSLNFNLGINDAEGNLELASHPLAKALLVAAIAFSLLICVSWLLAKRQRDMNRTVELSNPSAPAMAFALIVFYVAFSNVPILFGQHYYFHVSLVYPIVIYLALIAAYSQSRFNPVSTLKHCLLFIVVSSLLATLLAPALTLEDNYAGLIPGINDRLYGLTASPNTLGSVCSTLLILELAEPANHKWRKRLILLLTSIALLLTQSKTSIGAALAGWLIIYVCRSFVGNPRFVTDTNRLLLLALALLSFSAAFLVSIYWILANDIVSLTAFGRNVGTRALDDLSTATGRTWIWQVALQSGLENPLFGQGANFWSVENRSRLGLSGAVHAHNLFLQVFIRSGLFGLATLLVLLYLLIHYAICAAKVTRGGSIAILTVFLIRALFEVPLQPNSVLAGEFFATAALFFYVVYWRQRPTSSEWQPALRNAIP